MSHPSVLERPQLHGMVMYDRFIEDWSLLWDKRTHTHTHRRRISSQDPGVGARRTRAQARTSCARDVEDARSARSIKGTGLGICNLLQPSDLEFLQFFLGCRGNVCLVEATQRNGAGPISFQSRQLDSCLGVSRCFAVSPTAYNSL